MPQILAFKAPQFLEFLPWHAAEKISNDSHSAVWFNYST